jgi:hypothetical protein
LRCSFKRNNKKRMDETFTKILDLPANVAKVNEELLENLDADELMFYHSLRTDLELLKRNPQVQTIHNILNYSRSLR